jgi:peptidoglycan hydrolase-like protein with peptidoglycan-binding domain
VGVALAAACVVLLAACGDDDVDADPVAAAERRVASAQDGVAEAQEAFESASATFCDDSRDYIIAIDRYGQVFNQSAATVGDVKTAGADLVAPRETVESSSDDVLAAADDLAAANQELAEAVLNLAEVQSGTSGVPLSTTTTAPLVPTATVDRVEQAESDLTAASQEITDETPLAEATAQFNSAAFALQIAWLRLFADAGCLSEEEQAQAVAAVTAYTTALQTALQTAGLYDGPIDGIYGPETVAAVEQLQSDNGLPVTGFVDQATAAALDEVLAALGGAATQQAIAQTAAVQSTLALLGYWTGPVDGNWTPELTAALMEFQTALGVEPTGAVDAATLAALQQAIADAQAEPTTTTTEATTTTAAETTTTTG